MIGATENPEHELGIEFKPDAEDENYADVLKDLKLPPDVVHEPLLYGEWK